MLEVRSVIQGRIREGRFAKVERPQLRRLIIQGKGGWCSFDALAWLRGIRAEFLFLTSGGDVAASSGELGVDVPALRRAQALASSSPAGLEVARYLLGSKVTGQHRVLAHSLPKAHHSLEAIAQAARVIDRAEDLDTVKLAERNAATAYWAGISALPMRFARVDLPKVPGHWQTVGVRASALTGHPRKATTPAQAMWNYCYRLAEFEVSLACLGAGLDPGIGVVHADQVSRDNLVLDVIEDVRPEVDQFVLRLLAARTFARREFVELPNGNARLAPALARMLSETLPRWQRAAAPVTERVARMLAGKAARRIQLPTHLTHENRSRGREGIRKRVRPSARPKDEELPSACRTRGVILAGRRRLFCDDCLPERRAESAEAYREAGIRGLAKARVERRDTSASGSGRWKMGATNAVRRKAEIEWDKGHQIRLEPEVFLTEILPAIREVPLSQLMAATGLSLRYCSLIRRGLDVPHPRHWEALRRVGS
jgi:CRISPR-associated endonuclease Cas1